MQQKTINTIRVLSCDMVQKANSGHPGAPMGMAPIAHALWLETAKFDAKQPLWANRDRVVLSSGHASALLYSVMYLCGYPYSMEDLKNFRQWGSITAGHPEYCPERGVEIATGPLGQGIANAVGMAIAETMLAARFNRPGFEVVNHRTYALCGDGCMMEGISGEACSLAGTLKLDKLTVLYDDNEISIEGDTDIAFKEDVGARFEAYGWDVIRVQDGNDANQVAKALQDAEKTDKPTLIICPTVIAFGCLEKQGKASAHGEPLGEKNILQVKEAFGLSAESFHVDDDVYAYVRGKMEAKHQHYLAWQTMFDAYCAQYPELKAEWDAFHSLPDLMQISGEAAMWENSSASSATRNDSGEMINRLAQRYPNLVGGSADLGPSNKTEIKGGGAYSADNRLGRNLHFGVREHAMAAICNGMAAHGGLRVFCGTFLVFSDYMKNAMRMSAMMKLPVTYVLTHDSIGVGEDGETHQPIEQLVSLRSIPGMKLFRPCDFNETAAAWLLAATQQYPVSLALTRQNTNNLSLTGKAAFRGGYVLKDAVKPDIILMASGSEVDLVLKAADALANEGVCAKVVSMPCIELFLEQDEAYRASVLNPDVTCRLAVEAACSMPWYRFVGLNGKVIGMDRFGASAPAGILFEKFGLTAENVVQTARSMCR